MKSCVRRMISSGLQIQREVPRVQDVDFRLIGQLIGASHILAYDKSSGRQTVWQDLCDSRERVSGFTSPAEAMRVEDFSWTMTIASALLGS